MVPWVYDTGTRNHAPKPFKKWCSGMRKLTGYIGAMIIVIALMGSILAGYALNINGTSTVMNEYEKVTDVSGLYTHSQEPTYIDYNPASNYINYTSGTPYNSTVGEYNNYKSITDNITIVLHSDSTVTYNNKTITPNTVSPIILFFTDWGWFQYNTVSNIIQSRGLYVDDVVGDVTITISGNIIHAQYNNVDHELSSMNKIVIADNLDYDYYTTMGSTWGGTDTGKVAYFNYQSQIMGGCVVNNAVHTFVGSTLRYPGNNSTYENITLPFTITNHGDGLYSTNPYYGSGSITIGGNSYPTSGLFTLYPKTAYKGILGINYTESSRANNYPMETDYNTTQNTSTTTIDLSQISAANYYNGNNMIGSPSGTAYRNHTTYYYNNQYYISGIKVYKLSDILSTISIPVNTKTIQITTPQSYQWYTTFVAGPYGSDNDTFAFNVYYWNNWVCSTGFSTTNSIGVFNFKAIYNLETGIVDWYDENNNKMGTVPYDNYYIGFVDGSNKIGTADVSMINGNTNENYGTRQYNFYMSELTKPSLNLVFSTTGTITNIHYSDITKGYSIKSSNLTNTIWNNEYTNGKIQLLFRADDSGGIYHNDVLIGSNSISIDYSYNRYVVTLNGGDPVNIGTWRNIILDIDLINNKLSAIPVRTFNSFTNVVTDNTNIFIGDLLNTTPTNIIEWGPTPNSLMFNVYSTSVFMDTYGVVMVDPTMDITNYFTNLDNFYQLRLSNFSMYGQSMTVNGVTGTVTGDKITFNGETVQLKEMAITYADGNVTISDSYGNIDLGAIVDNTVSMTGAWYFTSDLYSGYTTQKVIYDWDWGQFILDDKAFGVIYIGLCLIGLIVARHFCTLTITDYLLFVVSIAIALTVPVIA